MNRRTQNGAVPLSGRVDRRNGLRRRGRGVLGCRRISGALSQSSVERYRIYANILFGQSMGAARLAAAPVSFA